MLAWGAGGLGLPEWTSSLIPEIGYSPLLPMPSSLRAALDNLAQTFASAVLTAIRTASIEELLAESGSNGRRAASPREATPTPARKAAGKRGRLARRTPEEVEATLVKVVSTLKATRGKGMRSEQIQAALKLDKREMPRVIAVGLQSKKLRRKGEKRATVYFVR